MLKAIIRDLERTNKRPQGYNKDKNQNEPHGDKYCKVSHTKFRL